MIMFYHEYHTYMRSIYPPVIKGQRYGHWTVITDPFRGTYNTMVVCECDCNRQKIVNTGHLKTGQSTSCGCAMPGLISIRKSIHGKSKYRDPLYIKWKGMRQRCKDPKYAEYERYGGRGITVCAEWQASFLAFEKWARENGYRPGLQIDRIDPDKDYSPENCRFTNSFGNAKNKGLTASNTSGYKGVSYIRKIRKWKASITCNYRQYHLGYFESSKEAAYAYDAAAKKHFKDFAFLNFPANYGRASTTSK